MRSEKCLRIAAELKEPKHACAPSSLKADLLGRSAGDAHFLQFSLQVGALESRDYCRPVLRVCGYGDDLFGGDDSRIRGLAQAGKHDRADQRVDEYFFDWMDH